MKQVTPLLFRCVMQRYMWTSIILLHLPLFVSAANNPVSKLLMLGLLRPTKGAPSSGLCVGWRNCGCSVVAVLCTHALHSEKGT